MTFLQPFVLWGLPLILVPVIIHLINRLRHRPQVWAATRFLLSATRSSISHAKLRQFLILFFRVMAVLALVLFLSRPLAGGWIGWVFSPAPDAILLLLDRSASMETLTADGTASRREHALKLLAQSAKEFDESSHLIVIDSALRAPQEIANAASLAGLSLTSPTDTAADLPAMLQTATKWLIDNRAGTAEIWIASDLQRSNWQPDDPRWESALAQIASLPQKVRVRLLALSQDAKANAAISLQEVTRRAKGGQSELHFSADLQRNQPSAEPIPLTISIDGARTSLELVMDGQTMRWRHRAVLGNKQGSGWGSLEVSADANRRDNVAYFVYGPETVLRATVVSGTPATAKYLQLAATAIAEQKRQVPQVVALGECDRATWEDNTLLLWQDVLPSGATADKVRSFIEEGGVVMFFPPGKADEGRFLGTGWGEIQTAPTEQSFRILRWDESQGPLAKTDEGLSLPVAQLSVNRRQGMVEPKNVLAAFDDGAPFLTRQTVGRGEAFFCATLPSKQWSSLSDGPVLVPMVQRLLQSGSRRLRQTATVECGRLSAAEQKLTWTSLDSAAGKDVRTQAGVYKSGDRLLAVNRPTTEDEPGALDIEEAQRLFGPVSFQVFQDTAAQTDRLQGEFWRVFLVGMLAFLLVEGLLILPPRSSPLDARAAAAGRSAPATLKETAA